MARDSCLLENGFKSFELPLQQYQATSPSFRLKRTIKESAGLKYRDPNYVLDELQIRNEIDNWVENLRKVLLTDLTIKWIANRIVRPLVDEIEQVDRALKSMGLEYLDCKNGSLTSTKVASQQEKFSSLLELAQKFPSESIVQARIKIEQYLAIPEYDCRAYVIERIRRNISIQLT